MNQINNNVKITYKKLKIDIFLKHKKIKCLHELLTDIVIIVVFQIVVDILLGIFHCNNMGHVGRDISSSFVNDGVCDCCDTSDEYLSNADCIDECHVLGEAARVEARHRAEVQSEGFNRRQKMAEEGLKLKKEKQVCQNLLNNCSILLTIIIFRMI